MKEEIVLNLVVFNYLDRPTFDVHLNEEMSGGSACVSDGPYGHDSTVTGVLIPLGAQTLTWCLGGPRGMPRNGQAVRAERRMTLKAARLPWDTRYLGVPIDPDQTAALTFSQSLPETSRRGEKMLREVGKMAHEQPVAAMARGHDVPAGEPKRCQRCTDRVSIGVGFVIAPIDDDALQKWVKRSSFRKPPDPKTPAASAAPAGAAGSPAPTNAPSLYKEPGEELVELFDGFVGVTS